MPGSGKAGQAARRAFLARTVGSVGALALSGSAALNANDRLQLGVVGTGSRGGALIGWAQRLARSHNVCISAVCDLWDKRRESAARRIADAEGRPPAVCRSINELLDRKDVDAVLIATADFQHCYHAAQAVLAGKDVYVEKPFGCDFTQVRRAYEVIVRSDRVLAVGTQARGADKYYAAAAFVQSGRLGQVQYVEISEPISQQRWRIAGSEGSPAVGEIDWGEYLTYLSPEQHPFDPRHFREFRLFWPFSSGPFCQWMSHRIDLVNLVLGKLPTAAVALGGVTLWRDGRTNPDTVQCLLEYPQGILVSYHMRMGNSAGGRAITFYGTNGTLDLESATAFGDGGGGLVVETNRKAGVAEFQVDRTRLLRSRKEGGEALEVGETIDYLGHFFDCVRSRQRPRGDVESAFGHATACILANQAYRQGVRTTFDPVRKEIGRGATPQ